MATPSLYSNIGAPAAGAPYAGGAGFTGYQPGTHGYLAPLSSPIYTPTGQQVSPGWMGMGGGVAPAQVAGPPLGPVGGTVTPEGSTPAPMSGVQMMSNLMNLPGQRQAAAAQTATPPPAPLPPQVQQPAPSGYGGVGGWQMAPPLPGTVGSNSMAAQQQAIINSGLPTASSYIAPGGTYQEAIPGFDPMLPAGGLDPYPMRVPPPQQAAPPPPPPAAGGAMVYDPGMSPIGTTMSPGMIGQEAVRMAASTGMDPRALAVALRAQYTPGDYSGGIY